MKYYFFSPDVFSLFLVLWVVFIACLIIHYRHWWTLVKERRKLRKKSCEVEVGGVPMKRFLHCNFSFLIISNQNVLYTCQWGQSLRGGISLNGGGMVFAMEFIIQAENDWSVSLLYWLSITISMPCNKTHKKWEQYDNKHFASESENCLLDHLYGFGWNCSKLWKLVGLLLI